SGGFKGCTNRWRLEETFHGTVFGDVDCQKDLTYSYISFKASNSVVSLSVGVGLQDDKGMLWTFYLKDGQPILRAGSTVHSETLRLTIADSDHLPLYRIPNYNEK